MSFYSRNVERFEQMCLVALVTTMPERIPARLAHGSHDGYGNCCCRFCIFKSKKSIEHISLASRHKRIRTIKRKKGTLSANVVLEVCGNLIQDSTNAKEKYRDEDATNAIGVKRNCSRFTNLLDYAVLSHYCSANLARDNLTLFLLLLLPWFRAKRWNVRRLWK